MFGKGWDLNGWVGLITLAECLFICSGGYLGDVSGSIGTIRANQIGALRGL